MVAARLAVVMAAVAVETSPVAPCTRWHEYFREERDDHQTREVPRGWALVSLNWLADRHLLPRTELGWSGPNAFPGSSSPPHEQASRPARFVGPGLNLLPALVR